MSSKNEPAYWTLFGRLCWDKQRFDIAEKVYRLAIKVNPKATKAWENLGLLLGRDIKQYGEAAKVLQKAVKLNPKNAGSWNNLGLALGHSGKFEEAEKAFREAIRLEKAPAYAWTNLGRLFLSKELFEKGEKCLREAIKHDPKHYQATTPLSLVLIAEPSRQDEGWKLLQELVSDPEIPTKDINFVTNLVTTLAVMGYARKVLDILKESSWAQTLEPVVVALRLILGEDVKAAAEIMEVAKDVVKRIEKQREVMKAAPKSQMKK
jgi:tetratricopeptide (TPR) repeat protein